ncbi:MAG: hypothetical protein COV67_02805 [Nitrospinae bacterium CG11_big_fil_rev_8_21_14_0_20_56_8]|nr:MAG: hypothetical protein COV67_02805 [Nitrospinae bacterium CG11_big_fil_rev_8_21_14_0_20_56_8]
MAGKILFYEDETLGYPGLPYLPSSLGVPLLQDNPLPLPNKIHLVAFGGGFGMRLAQFNTRESPPILKF